jgi:hypothetical protein
VRETEIDIFSTVVGDAVRRRRRRTSAAAFATRPFSARGHWTLLLELAVHPTDGLNSSPTIASPRVRARSCSTREDGKTDGSRHAHGLQWRHAGPVKIEITGGRLPVTANISMASIHAGSFSFSYNGYHPVAGRVSCGREPIEF